VAALQILALEVGVRDLAREEARAVGRLVRPPVLAHRTPFPAPQGVEGSWPLHDADVSIARSLARDARTALRARRRRAADAARPRVGDVSLRRRDAPACAAAAGRPGRRPPR